MKETTKQVLARIAERFAAVADDRNAILQLAAEVRRGHAEDVVRILCDKMVNGGVGHAIHSITAEYALPIEPEPVTEVAPPEEVVVVFDPPPQPAPAEAFVELPVEPPPIESPPSEDVTDDGDTNDEPAPAEPEPAKDEVVEEEVEPKHGKKKHR